MNTAIFLIWQLAFYTPHVPQEVRNSKYYWIGTLLVFVLAILYHNSPLNKQKHTKTPHSKPQPEAKDNTTISYTSQGRSGYVHYKSPMAAFSLYYEFGVGNCLVWIDIPEPANWEKETGLPLALRDETLHYIGKRVVQDQTTGAKGYYKIEGNALNIYNA